jgi:hypothetical protein
MPSRTEIQNIIEKAVVEVLAAVQPGLRAEIARRAAAELESLAPPPAPPGSSASDSLNAAMASIQEASAQGEILRHLLEGEARFAGRVALFVVKGGAVNGWQGAGFQDNEFVKNISLNTSAGLLARAIQSRVPAAGSTAQFDPGFMTCVAPPAEDKCLVLPLVVKEKVAALLYADAGTAPGGPLDASALTALTRWAALWLELSALRKSGPGEDAQPPYAGAATAGGAGAAAPPATEATELHNKARRFAKLLVEEIKLYNQPKVIEGKHNRDLYDRLKEDIEKSRATYEKRYGETPVASAGYFNQELIRVLADNDVSLMGASFPR